VVRVSHLSSDVVQLGEARRKQDDDATFLLIEQGQKVSEDHAVLDLCLGTLNRNGVGELDERDCDLVPLAVELALEVLSCVAPPGREVVFDAVGPDRVDDSSQPSGAVRAVDGKRDQVGGLLLPAPDVATLAGQPGEAPSRKVPSIRGTASGSRPSPLTRGNPRNVSCMTSVTGGIQ
jgi:hypothetical protein